MKRPKLKKASKRVSCSKRYKIQKKVRDHNKKLRRELKKKGGVTRPKKDPGVPNSAPFKEEVLREAEQRRLQIEEEKEKKRQLAKEERAKKRKNDKAAPSKESGPNAKKARKEKRGIDKLTGQDKNSKQFLCSEFNKVIDGSDVVLQVLDARDPLGSRCPQLEEAVLQRDGNKKLLLVLNKIDLVPKDNVEKWLACLRKEFPVVLFKASTQIQHKTVQAKKNRPTGAVEIHDLSRGASCFGGSCLNELLTSYAVSTKDEVSLRVGVVGFPNVGKSSLINSLKGVLACNAGAKRGLTRTIQEVHISKNVKLIDGPGIVAAPSNPPAAMALRSLQAEEGQENMFEAVRTLLKECDKNQIMLQYTLPDYRNSAEFLTLLAKKRGFLQKGGVVNTERAASVFLSDWTGHKMSYHCKPPEGRSLPEYLSEAVVAQVHSGWDLSILEAGNQATLKVVRCPHKASSVTFTSKGPTAGLMSVSEITEHKPVVRFAEAEPEQRQDPQQNPDQPHETEELVKPQEEKLQETSQEEKLPEAPLIEKPKPKAVHFPVNINPTAAAADDAYDFNTDFK